MRGPRILACSLAQPDWLPHRHGNTAGRTAGRTFYSTFLTGGTLLEPGVAKIDQWTPTNQEGYQRDSSERRFNKVTSFCAATKVCQVRFPRSSSWDFAVVPN
jgi:hypothetical protein